MDICLISTFLEVNRTRHFGRAAENLFLTQSAVSARIRQLEQQLGVSLFVRRRNDIRLTFAGRRFLSHAERIVLAWQEARSELTNVTQADSLSVGAVPALWDVVIEPWLAQTVDRYPEVTIWADIDGPQSLQRKILDGALNLGLFLEPPRTDELEYRELGSMELRLVSNRAMGDVDEALGAGYVAVDWGERCEADLARQVRAQPVLRLGMARTALAHLLRRGGAAYLPTTFVAPLLAVGRIMLVPGAPK